MVRAAASTVEAGKHKQDKALIGGERQVLCWYSTNVRLSVKGIAVVAVECSGACTSSAHDFAETKDYYVSGKEIKKGKKWFGKTRRFGEMCSAG